jgi:hypothetical protein
MLPADLAAGAVTSLLGLDGPLRLKIEAGLVAFATFPALAAVNAVLGYVLLCRLGGFAARHAALGVLAWLLATTVLPYSQMHFENSLELCLGLVIAVGTFRWAKGGGPAVLVAVGLATGLNVLTRLTNLADSLAFMGGSLFAAYVTAPGERGAWLDRDLRRPTSSPRVIRRGPTS